jgi:signal transduction histidine kinase
MEIGSVDRTPPLAELVGESDLERCFSPLLAGGIDGICVFDGEGRAFVRITLPDSPAAGWDLLPPEAALALRTGGAAPAAQSGWFGVGEHVVEAWPLVVGTDSVGSLLVCRIQGPEGEAIAAALPHVLTHMLAAGYAAWVTSELHMQASASSWKALTQQNADLSRAVEHLRQLDQLKSNFLATVSHELRTPLTSVIGFSEMLLEGIGGTLTAEQQEYVRTILSRGEELLSLITHVLEMSQLEAGAVRLDLRPCDLQAAISRALDTVRLAAQQCGIELVDESVAVVPVLVDPDKLQRILVNLLGNAIKFSTKGGAVRVRTIPAPIRRPFEEVTLFGEEVADAVRISVLDEGVGIAPEQLSRIFEAFYQVDAGPTRRHGGAGLGLSIVKNLVVAHGGDVWAQSEPGRGTAIHFTLPMASAQADPG